MFRAVTLMSSLFAYCYATFDIFMPPLCLDAMSTRCPQTATYLLPSPFDTTTAYAQRLMILFADTAVSTATNASAVIKHVMASMRTSSSRSPRDTRQSACHAVRSSVILKRAYSSVARQQRCRRRHAKPRSHHSRKSAGARQARGALNSAEVQAAPECSVTQQAQTQQLMQPRTAKRKIWRKCRNVRSRGAKTSRRCSDARR